MTPPASILLVDDEERNLLVLAALLAPAGYRVLQARSGPQALALAAATPPDVILLDVMMPAMDGFEVARRLRDDPMTQEIPIIMVTALSDVADRTRALEAGADDFLTKPVDPLLLRIRVKASLEKKLLRDEEARLHAQLRAQYEELQQVTKLKDDLTHMIVHDLRTPLTSLLTGLQTLDSLGNLDELQQELLALGIHGGATLLGMINDLLDISKMEDGSFALDTEVLSPAVLIAQVIQQVAPLADEKRLTLHAASSPDDAVVADRDLLLRVLVNLVGNGIKFTPEAGAITVTASRQDDTQTMLFSVADTGEGIPPEAFAHIFENFGQVETRQSGRKMSTGLGLTFCKMAVEAHGGRIWVESKLGRGSTFYFTIPNSNEGG